MDKESLRALPKVELHRHLDGSVRFDTILDIAKINNIDLGSTDRDLLWKQSKVLHPLKDLDSVLAVFATTQSALCNYEAIKRVAFENVEDCFLDGCQLAELRFAPTYISEGKELSNQDILAAVVDGISEAMEQFPIEIGLIFIAPRSFDLEKNRQATKDLVEFLHSGYKNADRLVGFDLADSEQTTNKKDFVSMVDMAREAGLGITIHSGEDTDAAAVMETLDLFRATRIGHGIKVWNNQAAMDRVKESNVLLEVCPISNWLTNSADSLEEHPLPKLYNEGVPVCLNSDDPHIMNIDLVDEYVNASEKYSFTNEHFKKMNLMALEHSFLPESIRSKVKQDHFS
jgi:adenosine deaminase